MKRLVLVLLVAVFAQAKDAIKVDVAAVHAVTHNGRSLQDFMLPNAPRRQVESYNIDAVINGEHVILACDDMKGCEAPAVGSYCGDQTTEVREDDFRIAVL